ncbi:NnrS family protein [uncultured Aliiroseovarius sp.]|uniref:NnrS family protein n=1 Tax=uncultured Aliiroseovarius sp. TaxID=1658783 RepID=UPI0025967E68|nr:NnrS family protein [uncultured Aliiroseovarius sp.]
MITTAKRILGEGFRAFFLGAAIWAVLSGVIWEVWLGGQATGGAPDLPGLSMIPQHWHAHEMVFGYAAAAIGGFFLTAVASGRGLVIGLLAALWLAGRVVLWESALLPPVLVAVIDLSFLAVLAGRIGLQLTKRPKPQHAIFMVFLVTLTAGNLMVHLDWLGLWQGAASAGLRVGILALCGLIIILGGRLTPGFIRNAMNRAGRPPEALPPVTPRLDRAAILSSIALPWSVLLPPLAPVVALVLALVHGARISLWRPQWALRDPLLWSLFAAQSLLVAGLFLWALAGWGIGDEVGALHVLALGGIGGMTLAVMSRATLGHTGRAPIVPRGVAVGYGLMILSALTRWLAADLLYRWYDPLVLIAGAAWIGAFVLFLVGMVPALTGPRVARPAPSPPPPMPPHMKTSPS